MLSKKIAHYVLDLKKRLGKGNFGEVFHAYDSETKNFVAIKQVSLQGKIQNAEKTYNQILNEIKIMKSISSPNVVAILDVQKTTNNLYIVMEYCNQGTLEEYMQKKQNLAESEAKMFLSQIINGFKHIVSLKVVHRDLKLSNILIHNGEAKIADFGFSKILEVEDQLLQTFAGSPLYMSYQILKFMNYTSKCDIWSLGIIYYELLYGKPPWLAISIIDLINQIDNIPLRFPEKPVVSKQSKILISNMLEKDENKRIGWEELFNHDFFNDKMQMEVEQNLKLSVQKIDGQYKDDPLRRSNAKQKIYFENPVLQNVQHAAKEQRKMKRVFEDAQEMDEQQMQKVQSPTRSNLSIEQETQDQNPQYLQQFQQNQIDLENQKIIQKISDWIIHRRNKSVFLNTLSQSWFDLYDRGLLTAEICQPDYYKLLFVLSKYQTMIFYRMNCRLETKQLEKYKKFTQQQWKIFIKSKEYKTSLEQIKNDFIIVRSFLVELLSKVQETLPQTSECNLKILSICNMEMIEKQIFDPIFCQTVDEIFQSAKKIIINNKISQRELVIFATHLKNALRKKEIFSYNPIKMVDFFKYYEEIDNETTIKLAQALGIQ